MSDKAKRRIALAGYMLLSIGIPAFMVFDRFEIVVMYRESSTLLKWSMLGLTVTFILFIVFYKALKEKLREMEYSLVKSLLNGVFKMIPIFCIFGIFIFLDKTIDDLVYVAQWFAVCNLISAFSAEPLFDYFNEKVLRAKRISEIREGSQQ